MRRGLRFPLLHELARHRSYRTPAQELEDTHRLQQSGGYRCNSANGPQPLSHRSARMTTIAAAGHVIAAGDIEPGITRKLRRRLIPLLFILYVVAYLDRINIGFAALTMNGDLGITSAQFGLLIGIFFWGYFLFE